MSADKLVPQLRALAKQGEDYIWRPAKAAADEIEQLRADLTASRAECDRLRVVLSEIADMTFDPWTNGHHAGQKARTALEAK